MANTRLKRVLLASNVFRMAARLRVRSAAILMYHSVLEDPGQVASSLGRMIHGRRVFQDQMELLAKEFNPVTLDHVLRFIRGEEDLPHRAVAVTFDDGYADNYDVALPILEQVGVPAAFYATVDCVENRRLPWPSRLRFAFFTTLKSAWRDDTGKVWPLSTLQQRSESYLAACDRLAQLAGEQQVKLILRIESDLGRTLPKQCGQWMLTWGQLRGLAQKGHIVGSHTMTHPNLAYLGVADARWELVESKRRLELQIGQTVAHFSYPCPALTPNWSDVTTEESRCAGFQTAVTTSSGLVDRYDNPLALRRIPPTKSLDGMRWNLEAAFAGQSV